MGSYVGLRVIRGPDWRGGDTDGGEGYLGTVTQLLSNQHVRVLWDMGEESTCSTGHGGKFELRIFDSASSGVRHKDTVCAGCGEKDVYGMLWRCHECSDCELCPMCYHDDKHDIRHTFMRIDTPSCKGKILPKRKTSVKARAIGMYPGSKVVRGKDWKWDDQDGGQGSEGEVKGYKYTSVESSRNIVSVKWATGIIHSYRLGYQGYVDLKCVEEEVGPVYYRDHLPLMDTTVQSSIHVSRTSNDTNIGSILKQTVGTSAALQGTSTTTPPSPPTTLHSDTSHASNTSEISHGEVQFTTTAPGTELYASVGDRVAIKVDAERLKELQQTCGGVTARMLKCIGRTGAVTDISSTKGIISVKYGSDHKVSYRFNPQVLMKVDRFAEQDVVRVREDGDLVRLLNSTHEWNSAINRTLGKVGRVVHVLGDGDIRVEFEGRQFTFAPACCFPAPGCDIDSIDGATSSRDVGSVISNPDDPPKDDTQENLKLFQAMRDLMQRSTSSSRSISDRDLFVAITHYDCDEIKRICEADKSKLVAEVEDKTPLIYASLKGRRQCMETLIAMGADVNGCTTTNPNKVPMSAAIEGSDPSVIEVLLQHGADTTHLYRKGMTAVHQAAIRDQGNTLKILAKYGADMNHKNDYHDTALHIAIDQRLHSAMEALISMPQVDIYIGNEKDFNAFHRACYVDNPRALERLIERDRNGVDILLSGDSAPLHIAATNDHVDCIRLLVIDGGADIHKKAVASGMTALHHACHMARLQATEALLELGADPNIADKDGDTPLHLAVGGKIQQYGKTEEANLEATYRIQIANMLITSGAIVDARDHAGRHPFMSGHSEVRDGVRKFITSNKHIVKWSDAAKGRAALEQYASSRSSSRGSSSGVRLKEALRDKALPCGVCGTPKSEFTLLPCRHKCVCGTCAAQVVRCPLCNDEVQEKFHTGEEEAKVDAEACKQM